MPMTVSAVNAAALAACDSPLSASVTRRTEAAASPVVVVKSETVPSNPWAAWKRLRAVASNPSRRACSTATSAWLFSTSSWLWRTTVSCFMTMTRPSSPRTNGVVSMIQRSGWPRWARRRAAGARAPTRSAGVADWSCRTASMAVPTNGSPRPIRAPYQS